MRHLLKDPELWRTGAFVGGEWVNTTPHGTYALCNPANNEVLVELPRFKEAETAYAIQTAHQAFLRWRQTTAKVRSEILHRWYGLMLQHRDDLATLITLEEGKPIAEAKSEIEYAASFLQWFSEESKRVRGDVIPAPRDTARIVTPLTALALAELARRAGVPAGVFNVVTGNDTRAIGNQLTSHPLVRKITFTGSTEVGRVLLAQAAPTIKKCSMELGGNAPFVIFDDADLDAAADGVVAAKFRNTGQACISANRVLVQAGIYDAFAAKLVERVGKLRVGNGLEAGVQLGPLIDDAALAKVEEHIADATSKGAQVLHGGKRHALGGRFFEPTVIAGVTPEMAVALEETFGPVAPLFKFEKDDDAIAMANATEFGLAAYLFSRDAARIWRTASALESGMVGINCGLISNEVAPFGGVKQSGLGREGSQYGIEEFLEVKYLCWDGLAPAYS
eukprot:gene16221-16398_t